MNTETLADGVETWSLVAIETGLAAAMTGDGLIHQLPDDLGRRTPLSLVADWVRSGSILREWIPNDAGTSGHQLLTPLKFPAKVLCAGANYRKHLAEMNVPVPGDDWEPFFFLKPSTTTITGPDSDIGIEWSDGLNLDWEAELAVVIGIGGKNIRTANASSHVAGYSVVNDVSARGPHHRPTSPAPPFAWDWLASKCGDGFCPLGPGIIPDFLIEDPHDLQLELWVNDELKQSESTGDMICSVPELISAASRLVTLEPGDVIATGTPSGVGAGSGTFLSPGDRVRVRATSVGTIENVFTAAESH